jgi:hypothetical protein
MALFGLIGDSTRKAADQVRRMPERMGDAEASFKAAGSGALNGAMSGLKWGAIATAAVVGGVAAGTVVFGGKMVGAAVSNPYVAAGGGFLATIGEVFNIKGLTVRDMANTAVNTAGNAVWEVAKTTFTKVAPWTLIGGVALGGANGAARGMFNGGDYADEQYQKDITNWKRAAMLAKQSQNPMVGSAYTVQHTNDLPDGPMPMGVRGGIRQYHEGRY